MTHPSEEKESLWRLMFAPGIWFVHFVACYSTVALWCGRVVGRGGPLQTARWLALAYTAVAVGVTVALGVHAAKRYVRHRDDYPQEFDTPRSRHRFLGFAELLLTLLSLLAVVYVALPFGFITSCR
jgi:hypothetical protein